MTGAWATLAVLLSQIGIPVGDHDRLAATLCAECLGCAKDELAAIAHTALNRVRSGETWWGEGLVGVLDAPGQFAYPRTAAWCQDVPPEAPARSAGHAGWSPGMLARWRRFRSAGERVAIGVLVGRIPDPVGWAMWFHVKRMGTVWPHLEAVDAPETWLHRFFRARRET